MICFGRSVAKTRDSLAYGWNQEKNAEVVFRQHVAGENPLEIANEFRFIQEQNTVCSKKALSFILSPTIEDGKKLKPDDLENLTFRFLKDMKLQEHQAVAFVHRDKKHLHIHLYVNRIDFNGKAYNDSFVSKRGFHAAQRVATELNLKTFREVQQEKLLHLKDIREEIKRRHDLTMRFSKPRTFENYIKAMDKNGVKVIPSINKANKLQGFRFEFQDHNLKGSEIHWSMTGGNIGKELAGRSGQKKFLKDHDSMRMMGKVVQLSDKLIKSITNQVIKRVISKGLEY